MGPCLDMLREEGEHPLEHLGCMGWERRHTKILLGKRKRGMDSGWKPLITFTRCWQIYSVKRRIVNTLGFAGHGISVATSQSWLECKNTDNSKLTGVTIVTMFQ